ncbi:MAG: 2Fe-2S iron-sulfur cluster-binding protein [Rhizomicrobium sp.]
MVHITYVDHENTSRTVDVPEGLSVMEGALRYHIPGIEGDCGGACACATCHVYVEPEWLARLAPPSQLETNMLKMAVGPNAQSRLSCQIAVTPSLEGLTVRTPETQY